ncbi:hypothetical protein BN7874_236 [Phage NCTB]|nr:hypothetical protein BN7874_236 [Phage NCTB]
MSNVYLNKVSETHNRRIEALEHAWEKAKNLASEKFEEDHDQFYPYVTGIFKRMMNISSSKSAGLVLEAMPKVVNTEGFKDVLRKLNFA